VDLQAFDTRQRSEMVSRLTSNKTQYNKVARFVESEGLREPMGSPLLLRETVEALTAGDENGRLDPAAGRKDLFGELEKSVYARERVRQNYDLRDEAHRAFLQGLAKEMLEANVREFDWQSVQVVADEAREATNQEISQAELERFADHHFLHVAEGSRDVRFNHQVFREYFQARAMVEAAQAGGERWIVGMLNQRPLPDEVAEFVGEVDEERALAERLLSVLERNERPSERFAKNLGAAISAYEDPVLMASYLRCLPTGIPLNLQLRSMDLSETDWSGRIAYKLEFASCRLDGASFAGSMISDLTLIDASIEGTDFSDVSIETLTLGYGDRVFGRLDVLRTLADRGALCDLPSATPKRTLEQQRRDEIKEIVKSRLKRFYLAGSAPDHSGSRWDSSIKEMNLLGGVDPSDRRFVTARVLPAFRTEGILEKRRAHGDVIYDLRNVAEDDARALIERDEVVGAIAAVIDRLQGKR
jgi:hypothetical protein